MRPSDDQVTKALTTIGNPHLHNVKQILAAARVLAAAVRELQKDRNALRDLSAICGQIIARAEQHVDGSLLYAESQDTRPADVGTKPKTDLERWGD